MTEEQWKEQVLQAKKNLDAAFSCMTPNEANIGPFRIFVKSLDLALFRGFFLYEKQRAKRVSSPTEISFEELFP